MSTTREICKFRKDIMTRYMEKGIDGFLESEILELLLVLSIPRGDIKPLATQLMQYYKELNKVHDASVRELLEIPGINIRTALFIKFAKECSEYYLRQKVKKKSLLRCGLDIINYSRMMMAGMRDENFATFFLNVQGEVIDVEIMQTGTVDQTVIYPRKIIERALFHNAVALIFAHNHPGGSIRPSYEDKELTSILVSAATIMDIEVFDHLIMSQDEYFSFRDEGLIGGEKTFIPVLRMSIHNNNHSVVSLNSNRMTMDDKKGRIKNPSASL
jgi:DNA repair protein RadC